MASAIGSLPAPPSLRRRGKLHNMILNNPSVFREMLADFNDCIKLHPRKYQVDKKQLDLHRLYSEVTKRGGFQKVVNDKKWLEISKAIGINPKMSSASTRLKDIYIESLQHFEDFYFHGRTAIPTPPSNAAATGVPPPRQPAEINSSGSFSLPVTAAALSPNLPSTSRSPPPHYPPAGTLLHFDADSPSSSPATMASNLGGLSSEVSATIDGPLGYMISVKFRSGIFRGAVFHPSVAMSQPLVTIAQPSPLLVHEPAPAPVQSTPVPIRPSPTLVQPSQAPVRSSPVPIRPAPAPVHPDPAPIRTTPTRFQQSPAPVHPFPEPIRPSPALVQPSQAPAYSSPVPIRPDPVPVHPEPAPIRATPTRFHQAPAPVHPFPEPTRPAPALVQPASAPLHPDPIPVQPIPAPVHRSPAKKSGRKRRRTTNKYRDPDLPKRPLSAYNYYVSVKYPLVKKANPDVNERDYFRLIRDLWDCETDQQLLSECQRLGFADKARYDRESEEYDRKKRRMAKRNGGGNNL